MFKIRQVVWVLGQRNPNAADDVVQEMALTAISRRLFGRGVNSGDLIAAANRAATERRARG